MSAKSVDFEYFEFEIATIPSWSLPFVKLLEIVTSMVDILFFNQHGQAKDGDRHDNDHLNTPSQPGTLASSVNEDYYSIESAFGDRCHPLHDFYFPDHGE